MPRHLEKIGRSLPHTFSVGCESFKTYRLLFLFRYEDFCVIASLLCGLGYRSCSSVEERLARLSGLGDQFEAFFQTVDFEVFRPDLKKTLFYSDGSKDGRPPFNPVLMFKILMIQTLNNLSDNRTEYLINDRLSFMRFLGLELSDRVPDAKTI